MHKKCLPALAERTRENAISRREEKDISEETEFGTDGPSADREESDKTEKRHRETQCQIRRHQTVRSPIARISPLRRTFRSTMEWRPNGASFNPARQIVIDCDQNKRHRRQNHSRAATADEFKSVMGAVLSHIPSLKTPGPILTSHLNEAKS
jgi:hypothetical protein